MRQILIPPQQIQPSIDVPMLIFVVQAIHFLLHLEAAEAFPRVQAAIRGTATVTATATVTFVAHPSHTEPEMMIVRNGSAETAISPRQNGTRA